MKWAIRIALVFADQVRRHGEINPFFLGLVGVGLKKTRLVGGKTAPMVLSRKKEDLSHTGRENPRTPAPSVHSARNQ